MKGNEAGETSIYIRFLKLVAAAFSAAVLFFFLLHRGGETLLQKYFETTGYMARENTKRLALFREYVETKQLSVTDVDALTNWVQQQKVVWIQIYKNHTLCYDSQYPYMDASSEFHVEGKFYEWDDYHLISFQDGDAQVFMTGMYTYQFFNYALIAEVFLSFLVFVGIVLGGIREVMRYIQQLRDEIQILESGNLNYPVTVSGSDELAVLAEGLNKMRKSIRDKIRQEEELLKANYGMITSLSHDLRTPLTSMYLYLEILKEEQKQETGQSGMCMEMLEKKMGQIRVLADQILEYSLQKRGKEPSMEIHSFREVFYDTLSENCICLERRGFRVMQEIVWERRCIRINQEHVSRILDNVISNLIQYADRTEPVWIQSRHTKEYAVLLFQNGRKKTKHTNGRTSIGTENISSLMEAMGGSCQIDISERMYRIELAFQWKNNA